MTEVTEARRRPPRPGGNVRGRKGGGMFAWRGQRLLGVGVKRLGRHQLSVHRAWCSALCTAGLSHSVFFGRREGQGLAKRESLRET